MPLIAAIREAERWTPPNILGGIFLLAVVAYVGFRLLQRYMRD